MITADLVKKLRDKTQASMSDCKKALEESIGDFGKAEEILKRRGKQIAQKREGKEAKAGLIEPYVHSNGRIGVLVELNCETDFVAKTEMLKELAHGLSMHVEAMNPEYLFFEDIPLEVSQKMRKGFLEELANSGKPENIVSQIIEGKLRKYGEEVCLLEQPFVKNPDQKVRDLIDEYIGKIGEKIKIGRFVRFEI